MFVALISPDLNVLRSALNECLKIWNQERGVGHMFFAAPNCHVTMNLIKQLNWNQTTLYSFSHTHQHQE